jgi:rhamnogalacturonyl hydrolase YesR
MRTPSESLASAAGAMLAMQRQSWEQGVAMQAFLELDDRDAVVRMAVEAANRALPDGRAAMCGAMDGVTDPCATGEALGYAAHFTCRADLSNAYAALVRWALRDAPRSPDGVIYHLIGSRQFWVDSLYMLPPFLASAGFFQEALTNLYGYWARLYDRDAGLMSHMWDEESGRFVRAAHWGVGNGWAAAALARMYDLLPEEFESDKRRIAEMGKGLIDALLRFVRPDGLFHDVVDDPDTFVETNLSQQLSYSIYRGMLSGWLPSDYAASAERLKAAAEAKLDENGFVRGVCGAPGFDRPGIAPEGQAFYLMMQSAAIRFYASRAEG